MRPGFLAFIFSLAALCSFSQGKTPRIMVYGEITDAAMNPVSYAHILIKSRNEGAVGDYYGRFSITALPGDTLRVSSVSFHDAFIEIPSGFLITSHRLSVVMVNDTVNLKEVVIYPWPETYEQFKNELLAMETEDPLINIKPFLPTPEELKMLSATPGVIFSMKGPFSLLYDQYSKEARQKRTYAELVRKDKAAVRYNHTLITRITGLKDFSEIRKFTDFCDLDVQFILNASEYELYAAILDCYDDFMNCPADTIGK